MLWSQMLHDHFSHLHLGFSRGSSFGMTGAIGMVCISYTAKAFVLEVENSFWAVFLIKFICGKNHKKFDLGPI